MPTITFAPPLIPTIKLPEAVLDVVAKEDKKTYTIVYSSNIPDTVYGAAQIVSALKSSHVKLVDYKRYDDVDILKGHERVIIVGLDLTNAAYEALKDTPEVTAIVQRENYEAFEKLKFSGKLKVITPYLEEKVSETMNRIGNTSAWLSFEWIERSGLMTSPLFDATRIIAARYFAHVFPVIKTIADDPASPSWEEDIQNKSLLFNLKSSLKKALKSSNVQEALSKVVLNKDEDGYKGQWIDAHEKYRRNLSNFPKVNGHVTRVDLSAEAGSLETLVLVGKTFAPKAVFKEEVGGITIYRIEAEDFYNKLGTAASLKTQDHWWEGPFYCCAKRS